MPRSVLGWIFSLGCLLAVVAAAFLARHYSDAFGLELHTNSESWLRPDPRTYVALYGDVIGSMDDAMYLAGGVAEVVVWSHEIPPFTSRDQEPFQRGFEAAIREGSEHPVRGCATVTTGEATWTCLEWLRPVDSGAIRQRIYLSGRGVTKAFVSFTAPEDGFEVFGSTRGWLERLEWHGPALLHAL